MKTIEEAAKEQANKSARTITEYAYSVKDFNAGVEFAQRWISVEEEIPENDIEVLCKIERLSWTDNKYAVAILREKRFWECEGRHISHYKDACNNCITHWRKIELL